jgi:tetratricopeptide (TPR) repeat protein
MERWVLSKSHQAFRVAIAALVAAALLLSLSANPRADKAETPLAFELTQLREAWLFGDDAAASARLDALRQDNRVEGALARWMTHMRAWLALEQGDLKTARECLEAPLKKARDAREYVRAARILVLFGEFDTALEIVRRGISIEPRTNALRRVEAGLLWLSGQYEQALTSYTRIVERSTAPGYPYIGPARTMWSKATPWADAAAEPPPARDEDLEEMWDEWEPPEPAAKQDSKEQWTEPFVSLFPQMHWFATDLPGLDRCIAEMAADEQLATPEAGSLAQRLVDARAARDRVNNLRSGDPKQREELEAAAPA